MKTKISFKKLKPILLKVFNELKDFVVIFVIIFGFGWLFINAQLILILIDNITGEGDVVKANQVVVASPEKKVSILDIKKVEEKDIFVKKQWDNLNELKKKLLEEKLSKKLKNFYRYRTDGVYKPKYTDLLKDNLLSYNIKFNTLPPDGRIIIPKIWVDVHIVNLTNVSFDTIKTANYDKYLYDGVVKYPYTPEPWQNGNIFIFWHTSYYWWKHNPYGTVFSKIPRLRHWDIMELSWKWKIYKYKIFKKYILWPKQVSYFFKKYRNWQYLTIMWCYPIWSDRQRMVIVAKRVE